MSIAKKICRFLIEYLGGIICSFITAMILGYLCVFYAWILKWSGCEGLGLVVFVPLLAGVPLGAIIGFALVDSCILKKTPRAQQIILGVLFGFVTSVCLIVLDLQGGEVKIFDTFYDGVGGVFGGFGVFNILCVLSSLLGYNIVAAKETPSANEDNSQQQPN
ncbi:MAG: hypothetical protein JSW23_06405 [Planctomycetota bacterium]|nr:MAG: hypothetical protein JSW23_06405 [Planctomycetota bacterium]